MDWQAQDAKRDARFTEIRDMSDAERKAELTTMLQRTIDNGLGGTIHAIYWKPYNRWLRAIVERPDGETIARYWYSERECRWRNTGDAPRTVSRMGSYDAGGWDGSWNPGYWNLVAQKSRAEMGRWAEAYMRGEIPDSGVDLPYVQELLDAADASHWAGYEPK